MTRLASAAAALVATLLAAGCGSSQSAAQAKRVIVLGIDAMDPAFVERHWADLPNLSRLRDSGNYQRLATTIPPQSPVAWSTFTTGMNPGGHGVFDFIHRDPKTMALFSSLAETEPPSRTLTIGPYLLPLNSGRVHQFRKGRAFWQLLDEQGVPATLLRMPNNFPPVETKARSLSGMGTPDMLGTFGTFTFFTSEPGVEARAVAAGMIVPVHTENGRFVLTLEGPENTLRKDRRPTRIEISAWVDAENASALFEAQENRFVLRQGEWSEWIRVGVPIVPVVKTARAMFRVYAKQLQPFLQVYVSPLNVDPSAPELPISTPSSYSAELAAAVGPYYTQGIAEDTAALREGILTMEEYRQQSGLVAREQFALLHYALRSSPGGVVFFHFLGIDQDSHVYWGRHEAALLETYKEVDREVGRVMREYPDATLLVISDHGFSDFTRAVHLNTWLWREAFLALDHPSSAGPDEGFAHVEWSRTSAYSAGLNGIYLNLAGRERDGIIGGSEAAFMADRIATRLESLRDPQTGAAVVAKVYHARDVYRGDALASAPDLIVGWNAGYRSSWQTALGGVPPVIIEDNLDEWRGDHCIAAHLVPGVFFSNRKPRFDDLRLEDITVTLLAEFGVAAGPGMTGRAAF